MCDVSKKDRARRKLYADQLVERSLVTQEEVERVASDVQEKDANAHEDLKAAIGEEEEEEERELDRTASPEPKTSVSADTIRHLNEALLKVPDSFTTHRKLKPLMERRIAGLEEGKIDWAHAEELAWASLLYQS